MLNLFGVQRLISRVSLALWGGALLAVCAGCTTSRITTTSRTAIEQALISQSAELVLNQMDSAPLKEKTFHIMPDQFKAVDSEYILLSLRERILREGGVVKDKSEDAEFLIYPRAATVGIDDHEFLFGIPAIGLPGAMGEAIGGMKTPELALFKLARQQGRSRLAFHCEKRETGEFVYSTPLHYAQRYYTRYTILIFFGFRTTNLSEPF